MTEESTSSALELSGDLTIKNVDALNEQLTSLLDNDAPAVIDASAVANVDTAALQLLLAFSNTCKAAGKALGWQGVAESIEEQLARLGLSPAIEFTAVDNAEGGDETELDEADLCPVF